LPGLSAEARLESLEPVAYLKKLESFSGQNHFHDQADCTEKPLRLSANDAIDCQ